MPVLGLILLLLFIANVWAIISTLASNLPLWRRLLWVAVVCVPLVGLLLWLAFGPRAVGRRA
ncbi:MAG: hypothetical protein KDG89_10570 [Geminicoccaceae bacterium]|nr:hypothetical protein [Geminicoccaceae bacterium]